MVRFLRPKASVLPDAALVPNANLIQPPRRFTHEVRAAQPYHYGTPADPGPQVGVFEAGTRLALLEHDGGPLCSVADARGLRVTTAFDGLTPIR